MENRNALSQQCIDIRDMTWRLARPWINPHIPRTQLLHTEEPPAFLPQLAGCRHDDLLNRRVECLAIRWRIIKTQQLPPAIVPVVLIPGVARDLLAQLHLLDP